MESITYCYYLNDPRSRYGTEERTTLSSGGSASDTVGGEKWGQEQGPYLGHETRLQKKTDRSHSVLSKAAWGIWIGSNSHLLLCWLILAMDIGHAVWWAAELAAPRWVSLFPAPTHGPTQDVFFFHCLLWRAVPFRLVKTSPPGDQKKALGSKPCQVFANISLL